MFFIVKTQKSYLERCFTLFKLRFFCRIFIKFSFLEFRLFPDLIINLLTKFNGLDKILFANLYIHLNGVIKMLNIF